MLLGVAVVLLFVIAFYFFFSANIQTNKSTINSQGDTPLVSSDPVQLLKESNPDFKSATELGNQKKFSDALTSFEKARLLATDNQELSIIDFAIADTKFNIVRNDGIESFNAVAKNPAYPERTRALAMIRAFLLYFKYEDQAMLGQLANAHDIPWTIPEEVTYQYMRKVSDLYPFALARIWMLDYELNQIVEAPVAKQMYGVNRDSILQNIDDLKKWSGERMELTSTMSAHARLLSRLSVQYDAIPVTDVQAAFESLIDYGNTHGLTTNKQYTLLYYANFLSGAGEFDKAVLMIEMILKEGLDPAVAEALPRFDSQVRLPYFKPLVLNTKNEAVIAFVETIGSDLQ